MSKKRKRRTHSKEKIYRIELVELDNEHKWVHVHCKQLPDVMKIIGHECSPGVKEDFLRTLPQYNIISMKLVIEFLEDYYRYIQHYEI